MPWGQQSLPFSCADAGLSSSFAGTTSCGAEVLPDRSYATGSANRGNERGKPKDYAAEMSLILFFLH